MGKVLRVLVIVILILGLGALVLSVLNFSKREVLIGRTHALEEEFIKLSRTLEAEDPVDVPQPSYPQRDLSAVTSREMDNPERSAFWDSYNHKYEPSAQPIPTLDMGTEDKRLQLRAYYRIDPATGKPAINPLTGRPDTSGSGTMSELLEQALTRAKAQNELLHKTRAELPKLRDELIATIEELNSVKQMGRADKKTIVERDARIAQLENEKRELEQKIALLEEEKRDLNAQLAEAKNEIEKYKEEIKTLDDRVTLLTKENRELRGRGMIVRTEAVSQDDIERRLTPGEKGKIVSFNEQWKFVVVEFDPVFMNELLGEDRSQPLPQFEMMVRRPGLQGAAGDFVTRLRLRQVIREQNLVVADILSDWQQVPMELGDVVYL